MALRLILAVMFAFAIGIVGANPVRAGDPVVNAVHGAAINGYDVVAYFTIGEPTRGLARHKVKWRGAMWYFVTAKHREAFEANPHAFAPRYGGYCAYAMSKGKAATGDPFTWRIVDGRLYLMHGPRERQLWLSDIGAHVALANGYWPKALGN